EVRLNGGAWVTIGGTTPGPSTPWGSWVSLVPGSNWIQARAFDIAGNASPTQSVNVQYTPASDPVWTTALLTDMASYLPGAPVIVEYRVTNTSASPITLHFPTTCQASFDVRDVFNTVHFNEGAHTSCFFVFTERTWQPGQTVVYSFNWTQVDDAGLPVPWPASYQIRGFMLSEEPVPDGLKLIDVTPNPANPVWETTLLTDMASYPPGTPVDISYRVKNLSTSPATLHFPNACEAAFDVRDASDTVVYRQLAHVGCPTVLTQRTWQPGEAVTYDFTWPQTDDAGAPVPAPAGYRIRAFMLSNEVLPYTEQPIDITSGP
ncbi:MAG TPA: BsuPI-related putative proteinase inhibitor, partial [Candidatus Cryosericum sp.]|nr:BsuPI-related putative proteinase inhibitor [Candidatus Cryosericum sp.]